MPTVTKNLGQLAPSNGVVTDLYVVPSGGKAEGLALMVANRAQAVGSIRISHAIAGAADNNSQYLYWGQSIQIGETLSIVLPKVVLASTDVLRVTAFGSLSFNLYGTETTP